MHIIEADPFLTTQRASALYGLVAFDAGVLEPGVCCGIVRSRVSMSPTARPSHHMPGWRPLK